MRRAPRGTGRQEARYRRMYNATVTGLLGQLVVRTRRHTYLAERHGRLHHKMDHLVWLSPKQGGGIYMYPPKPEYPE
jgi:hypothetical protein